MLHELVFLGGGEGGGSHSQLASYPYTLASPSYSCKILQPNVAATVRMHSDVVLSFTGVLLIKTVIKIFVNNKWSTFASAGFGCRIHVNQPLHSKHKNIFLVLLLILKHVLFRLMHKYLSSVINCLLCSMSLYSWGEGRGGGGGVILSSHRIRTR